MVNTGGQRRRTRAAIRHAMKIIRSMPESKRVDLFADLVRGDIHCLGVRVDLVVHVPIFFAVRHPVEPVAGDVETLALEQCVRLTEDVTVGWPV